MFSRHYVTAIGLTCLLAAPVRGVQVESDDAGVRLQGTVVFADGTAAGEVHLEFTATGRTQDETAGSEEATFFHTQTDTDGRFAVQVRHQLAKTYTVVAQKWVEGNRLSWRTQWPDGATEGQPVELVFENRGRMLLRLFGDKALPDDYDVRLEIASLDSDAPTNLHYQLSREQHGLTLTGLAPGEYRVDAYVQRIRPQPWSTTIRVPTDFPYRGVGTLQFPGFQFGALTAKVQLPDGIRPASGEMLWIEADGGDASGQRFAVDPQGILKVEMLPVGKVRLRPLDNPRLAPVAVMAEIRADRETDLGTLRLQSVEEVYSWLEGSLTDAEGRPLPGVTCDGMFSDSGGLAWTLSDELGVRCTYDRQSASYRIRFPAGQHRLKIDVSPTQPPFGGGFLLHTPPKRTCLIVDGNVQAGATIRRDIVLPTSAELRNLDVSWSDSGAYRLTVYVPLEPGLEWATEEEVLDAGCTLSDVPAGPARVQLRKLGEPDAVRELKLATGQNQARF